MSNKFRYARPDLVATIDDLYFTITNDGDQWWWAAGTPAPVLETYDGGHYAGYDLPITHFGAGRISGEIPADLPAGNGYTAWLSRRTVTGAGNEASTDDVLAAFDFDWDGEDIKNVIGDADGRITVGDFTDDALEAIFAFVVFTGWSFRRLLDSVTAALGGLTSGFGTGAGTGRFRNLLDTKNQITVTMDEDGNRTSITHGE